MTFNWKIVIIVILALVLADKFLTIVNINPVKKNFPEVDPLKIEKNPLARFLFNKFGLYGGIIIHTIITLIGAFLFLWFLGNTLSSFNIQNSLSISLYIFILFYGFVLANNFYFLLKFSKIVS